MSRIRHFHGLKRLPLMLPAAGVCVLLACDGGKSGPRWAPVGHRCASDAPATSLSAAARDSLPALDTLHNQDDRWAQRARTVPGGWGGFFMDHGVPTIYLTDPKQRTSALAALNRPGLDGHALGPDVQVRRGRWDFAQLDDWYRYLNLRLGFVQVVSTDIDEAQNRIAYTVTGPSAISRLEARLAALHVPCFLVSVEVVDGYPSLVRNDMAPGTLEESSTNTDNRSFRNQLRVTLYRHGAVATTRSAVSSRRSSR